MNEKQRKFAEEVKEIILDYYDDTDDILMISLAVELRSGGGAPVKILVPQNSIWKFLGKGRSHIAKLISRLPSECFTKMNDKRGRWIHIEGYAPKLKLFSNECSNCGVSWKDHETCIEGA